MTETLLWGIIKYNVVCSLIIWFFIIWANLVQASITIHIISTSSNMRWAPKCAVNVQGACNFNLYLFTMDGSEHLKFNEAEKWVIVQFIRASRNARTFFSCDFQNLLEHLSRYTNSLNWYKKLHYSNDIHRTSFWE